MDAVNTASGQPIQHHTMNLAGDAFGILNIIFAGPTLGEIISSNFVRDYLIVSSAVGQSRQCNLYGTTFGCENILQLLAGDALGI